ncbi:MAG TPA: hypothetical protein VNI57_07320 [Candidatus Saccharimonadales bacterium]|nr:hypothetical protein [Candidatus Saccharimonadales bacterium]
MKRDSFPIRNGRVIVLVAGIALLCGCGGTPVFVPPDAQPTCTETDPNFNSWFESGSVSLDGVVTPADSVHFPDVPNCSFYVWSERMFLWLTSPAPARYGGGGGRIFNSPAFYDVSPVDSSGKRSFVSHAAGGILATSLRAAQVGPHNLPIIFDRSGKMFSLEPPVFAKDGNRLIFNADGERVEIRGGSIGIDGRPIFRGIDGKEIDGARPIIREELRQAAMAQEFRIDGVKFFLGASGEVIDVDQGQAGGNQVLMAQTGSLVYYRATVNDTFAYFLTGVENGDIPSTGGVPLDAKFPTTQSELDQVSDFASAHGHALTDPEALIIEIKTSWIETTNLDDPSDFITVQGTIPTYDQSNPAEWTPNGQKTVQLALVGIHVVGSTKGHPEMIWATFEHVRNTPNAAYQYVSTGGSTTSVAQNTAGDWLFSSNGSAGPFNVPHMSFDPGSQNIVANPGFTISPSDTIRWKAWGKADPAASSNTEVISINNSVLGKLLAGDIRRNYVMTGATWTPFGVPPTPTNQVGTNKLANTTLETYQQGTSNGNNGTSCLSCHVTNTVKVSHSFQDLKPLF